MRRNTFFLEPAAPFRLNHRHELCHGKVKTSRLEQFRNVTLRTFLELLWSS
jgi:hypothetical protein